MRKLAFRNESVTKGTVDVGEGKTLSVSYEAGHLRLIPHLTGVDPNKQADYQKQIDPTLGTFVGVVDVSDDPASRRFRNCWRHDGKEMFVHVDLAKQQVMDEVRLSRNTRMTQTDQLRPEDVSNSEKSAAMVAYRQALRDLPATVEKELAALKTPEQLEAYQPKWPEKPV